jgi:acyl-CoA synthetase (AMP-forming)/AMP-acid ligase II
LFVTSHAKCTIFEIQQSFNYYSTIVENELTSLYRPDYKGLGVFLMAWFSPKPLLIPDIMTLNAASLATKDAVIDGEQVATWAEFGAGTAKVANALLGAGLGHGDRVVVLMSNSYEMAEAMFGIIRGGLCAVPLNCAITDEAVAGMIANSEAKAVIASGEHIARVEGLRDRVSNDAQKRLIGVKAAEKGWLDYHELRDAADTTAPDVAIKPTDECNVIYSSGTTGLPKGIVHDHACREAWGSDMAVALRYHSGARTLLNLGLFSNISWVAMLATLFAGGTLVIQRRFDIAGCLELIQRERITHTVMVPLQFQKLLEYDHYAEYDLSSLDAYMCCGSPLAAGLKREIVERMPGDFIELYGLTEGLVTILSPEDMLDKTESVGRACPGQYLAIIDEAGEMLPAGEAGEIVGECRFLMAGYHDNPEADEEATWMHPSGARWLRTGDVGKLDEDGFLYLVDRKKDMILSGGQNIYPADIEASVVKHEAVSEVAVIGVAHEKWGETPLAVCVLAEDAKVQAEDLVNWSNERLGKQQRLSGVVFVDALPRNPNGKVLKRELRKQFDKTGSS